MPRGRMPWLTIVGVVGDLKHTQLMNEMSWTATPNFYRPLTQEPPIGDVDALGSRLAKTLAYPRFRAMVLIFFAVGAQTHHLLWLVVRQGGIPVVAGLGGGILAALAFSRVLGNLLYGIQPVDATALAGVSLMTLAVAGVAIVLPARRASRIDPMTALREE